MRQVIMTVLAVALLNTKVFGANLWCDGFEHYDFEQFAGAGFSPMPALGQLDSDLWRVVGGSDGDGTFGGIHDSGDFARGTASQNVRTGGVYSFDVGAHSGVVADWALGLQATGADYSPGVIEFRLRNDGLAIVDSMQVDFEIHAKNDGGRATRVSFVHANSAGDGSFGAPTEHVAARFASAAASDAAPVWETVWRSVLLEGLRLTPGDELLLGWRLDDLSGSGSRDEVALDDLRLTVVSVIGEPGAFTLLAASGLFFLGLRISRRGTGPSELV